MRAKQQGTIIIKVTVISRSSTLLIFIINTYRRKKGEEIERKYIRTQPRLLFKHYKYYCSTRRNYWGVMATVNLPDHAMANVRVFLRRWLSPSLDPPLISPPVSSLGSYLAYTDNSSCVFSIKQVYEKIIHYFVLHVNYIQLDL